MLTKRNLDKYLSDVKEAFIQHGYNPVKMVLFGSYAKGGVKETSDVDLAVWSEKFSGNQYEDMQHLHFLKRRFPKLDLKTFPATATALDDDPFIEIIERTGICIYEQEKQK